jgi:dihydroorotate dehydrogenase (fumarate)
MDLTTTYLGLTLPSPLIAAASPVTLDVGNIRALEDHGAGAVVLPSIFEEQINQELEELEHRMEWGSDSFAEALSYFPPAVPYRTGSQRYLETIRRAREAVNIPIIASLNGVTDSGWTDYARDAQQAGAHAIELNIYYTITADLSLDASAVERHTMNVLRLVRAAVSIPVAVKMSPHYSALAATVRALEEEGANGFVLFNRFYQPDIDLSTLRLKRDLTFSNQSEIRLPLLWLALLSGRVRGSLAANTGVETADEVVKYLLVGADVVQTASALLRHGVGHMRTLRDGLVAWMEARGSTITAMRGKMSLRRIKDPSAFERANYIRILQGWKPE